MKPSSRKTADARAGRAQAAPRARTIGGRVIVPLRPSRALPPLRLERAPNTAAERKALEERCLQIVFKLQGAVLPWRTVQVRAQAMANEAVREAQRAVREPAALRPVIERPPAGEGYVRTRGGIIVPHP